VLGTTSKLLREEHNSYGHTEWYNKGASATILYIVSKLKKYTVYTGSLPYNEAVPIMAPPSYILGSCFKFDI
jgi:hypothetical protein